MSVKLDTTTHIVIPDCQVAPGVPVDHLGWIGQFIVDEYAGADLTVVHLGDHFDMESLSSYDRGKKAMEGRRYLADIEAGNHAFDLLCSPLHRYNKMRIRNGRQVWEPRRVFLMGNHEYRINRAAESDAQLEGLLTIDALNPALWGWEVHGFLEPVWIDGICYSHYFANPMTGRPYSGANLETRLKTVGHSFTAGHQQGLKWGRVETIQGPHIGLVAGSCYQHNPDYLGPQAVNYWRGIVVKHSVASGEYDPMFVSLDYLRRRYA